MDRTFDFRSLAARIFLLAVLFGGEAFVATLRFDGATPVPSGAWITSPIHTWAPMPATLAGASPMLRDGWIGLRILGVVLTVPIAEELAFRGFVLRRFVSADFDSVSFRSAAWLTVLGSSLLFGVMHGQQWLLPTLAGAVYALPIRRTGANGDAVVAHAFTNALLAAFVLLFNQWQPW